MSRQLHDSSHLNSSRGRRDHSLGRRGSEAGSSRSLYGHDSASRSVGNVRESADGLMTHTEEEAKWIHRDKLAKIESEELHQAARLFHRRTGESKSSRGRSHISGSSSLASPPAEYSEPWPGLQEEDHDYEEDEDESNSVPYNNNNNNTRGRQKTWDLRRPEEIAADEEAGFGFYSNPALRKSSSRIPIPTASPAPILHDHAGREISRSRATTIADDDAAAPYSKSRRGSEAVSDDNEFPFTSGGGGGASTTPSSSRPNSRSAQATMQGANGKKPATTKGTGTNTARKTSGAAATGAAKKTTTPKSRTTSGAGNTQRPSTRGADSRPTTAVNRPEGDPPWLATMYKPDPRLPPDQQIIPTHARRVQQEQWEKEGKTPTTYDREFAPLAITPDQKANSGNNNNTNNSNNENSDNIENAPPPVPTLNPPSPPPAAKLSTEGSSGMWPLTTPEGPETKRLSGVYSPMPKVQDPSSQGVGMTPKWSPPVVSAEPEPPKEKKAGCGCCVVM